VEPVTKPTGVAFHLNGLWTGRQGTLHFLQKLYLYKLFICVFLLKKIVFASKGSDKDYENLMKPVESFNDPSRTLGDKILDYTA
jgi:hypothetical protein